MMVVGILFVYSLGAAFENYRWIAAVCGVFPVLCSILMIFTKESPYYLISKFKEEEAEESLKYFRGLNFFVLLILNGYYKYNYKCVCFNND